MELEPYEKTFEQLGKVLVMQERPEEALAVYMESLQLTPDNADVLCQIGLLHLRQGDPDFHCSCGNGEQLCWLPAWLNSCWLLSGQANRSRSASLCWSIWTRAAVEYCMPAGDNEAALSTLQKANAVNPQHSKATLALGSVLQDGLDLDGALLQYRVAAAVQPNIPQVCFMSSKSFQSGSTRLDCFPGYGSQLHYLLNLLHGLWTGEIHTCSVSLQVWNNVGLCFLGKQRYIAAIACLKRAQYLGPFEWIVCYNLGLVHLNTAQYAAAFNYFSAAINLRPTFAHTYMYLGVTLARLGDLDNALHAYERAIGKDDADPIFYLNYGMPSPH